MAIIQLLQQLLTTKATAVLAAFAMIGGGAAIAMDGSVDDGQEVGDEEEVVESEPEWALGRVDNDQMDRIADFCEENPEASFCADDATHPVFRVPADGGDDEIEAAETPGGPDGDEGEEPGDESADAEPEGDPAADGEEDTRSATAKRVHEALTDDETTPGPGFGQKVSARAQNGGLGKYVSSAARGEEDAGTTSSEEDEEASVEEPSELGAAASDDELESSDDGESEVGGPPADAGRPAGTPAANRGNGRGGQ